MPWFFVRVWSEHLDFGGGRSRREGGGLNKTNKDIYDDYFKFRNVTTGYYSEFHLPAYLKKVLPVEREDAILDIGCGLGQMLKALGAIGYGNLSGVDISQSAVASCRAEGLNVDRIESIAEFRPEAGKRFDFIIMSHVIEHIEKPEIVATLRAIKTHLLNEGGQLVIMTPNAQSHTGCYWAYEDFTHSTIFTAGSLYFVLKSAGFEQVDFLDSLGTDGSSVAGRLLKNALISLYRMRLAFWNQVTGSSFHKPSPQIFTFELKALAR